MESLTASGRSLTDCHALTSRYDETTDVEGAYEALVVHGAADGKFYAVQSSPGYRDLWRSPSGRLYVAAFHEMHWSDTPTQGGGGWERHRTGGIVRRVGGLDDTLVFAHGGGHDSPMFRFDGSDWVPLASPGVVLAIHGTSPDLLYCVGARGLIARWDGVTWAAIPASAMGSFRDICVVSADEMYAVHEGGLWQGSVNGWAPRLTADHGTLLSVAKWNDEVWVGTTDRGLCQLRGEQLVSVKGNLFPTRLDARGPALITAQSNMVAATEDGSAYRGWTLSRAAEVWAQQPEPYWLR